MTCLCFYDKQMCLFIICMHYVLISGSSCCVIRLKPYCLCNVLITFQRNIIVVQKDYLFNAA